jgi:transcriptional regulator with XRE-family HTH domain
VQKLRLMNPTETFGDFIRRIRTEKNLSCADVERRSARFGKPIAGSYINRIENDPKLRPTADRLRALANGLGVPIEELLLRAVGVGPSGTNPSDELHLITAFRELSAQRKADVLGIVDMWHSEEEIIPSRGIQG